MAHLAPRSAGAAVERPLGRDGSSARDLFRPTRLPSGSRAPAGIRDHRKPLWTLLMFQLWYDHWIDQLA